MVKALFDTNILIDYLQGELRAKEELARYAEHIISVITWMEVMVGATPNTKAGTEAFLRSFTVLPLDEKIAERAVVLRQAKRIKLPDAIIWASAQVNHCILVTRNSKDIPGDEPGVRVPYLL